MKCFFATWSHLHTDILPVKYYQLWNQQHISCSCTNLFTTFVPRVMALKSLLNPAISQTRSINFKSILLCVTLRWGITNKKKHTLQWKFWSYFNISQSAVNKQYSNPLVYQFHTLKTVCNAKVHEAKINFCLLPRLSI